METKYKDIVFTKRDGKATIVLNRPETLNAYGHTMMQELMLAIRDIEDDNEVKVAIITGAGRGFCSGHDMQDVSDSRENPKENLSLEFDPQNYPPLLIYAIRKPVIGAINGPAAGGGLGMALACDVRIASENAAFYESHVTKVGTTPGLEALLLPRLVGLEKALELTYTGEKVDATEAQRIGLVSRVVPPDRLMEAANELADKIAAGPLWALMLSKKSIFEGLALPLDGALNYITLARRICEQQDASGDLVKAFKR